MIIFKLVHMSSLTLFTLITTVISFTSVLSLKYRLDTNVLPEAYDIKIKPYLLPEDGNKQFTFDGEVKITLKAVIEDVSEIVLHKDYINITNSWLYDSAGNIQQTFNDEDLSYESPTDKLYMRLTKPMSVYSKYTLHFKYTGQMRDGMAGFFRANYTDNAGTTEWIGVTQAQRIDARVVFPCFDEPAFKAKFRMHISRPKKYNSIFNTRLNNTETDVDGRFLDHFDETPIMSSYLIAFIVSDFIASKRDNEFAIIVHPDYINKTEFSFEVGQKTLQAYNDYTLLPYKELGNPIMQKAGSPKFPHNGMENWGLVIYKDSVLVHEPGYTDGWKNKEYTITILVHETAHMWFGNSVTFEWWSYFWLNEAFARYYQYFLAHEIYPEYQLDQQFIVKQIHLIFGIDAVITTQPLTSPESSVETPSEIAKKFSSIAYAKGATIVRMIRNLMGNNNFDNAVREYLSLNHLKNIKPEDLFMQLKKHWPTGPSVNLDEFFYDWTEQVGFPVLFVELEDYTLVIRQTRFLLDPSDGSNGSLKYTIPITYTTSMERDFNDLRPKFYFNKRNASHQISWDEKRDEWIIFNIQQSNYYRVFYNNKLYNSIKKALMQPNYSQIHVNNRAQLVDDLFNFGRINMISYNKVFQFIEYLEKETEYLPWYAAFLGFQLISQRLMLEHQPNFGKFLIEITEVVYKKLGFHNDEDTVLDVYNRNLVVAWLCKYQHTDCNEQARAAVDETIETGIKPSPDFRETVYCSGARNGISKYYDVLDKWFNEETLTSEKELLIRAMGCTLHFAENHYARILTNLIPREYKVSALTPMYTQNPGNVTPVFRMISDTIERLADALGSWSTTANVISGIANYFTTIEQQKMLDDFILKKGKLFGTSESTLHNAAKNVKANLYWADAHLQPLLDYLKHRNGVDSLFNSFTTKLLMLLGVFFSLIH